MKMTSQKKMSHRIKRKNQLLGLTLLIGLLGSAYEAYQTHKISKVNRALIAGEVITGEEFPFHKKFAEAYHQGKTGNFKLAVQGYSQLLESPSNKKKGDIPTINAEQQSKIHFNIATNLVRSGLVRLVNADGSLQDDAVYAYKQATASYEQSLRLTPNSQITKFNLSLLHSVIPKNMRAGEKDQAGMALSNLPQGLP
jgi:mxaK protein